MNIHKIITGTIQENCYILEQAGYGLIIDPGDDGEKIIQKIEELDIQPIAVLLTHAHFDHIGALDTVTSRYDLSVYIHHAEEKALIDPDFNLSSMSGKPITTQPADKIIYTEGSQQIGPFQFEIRHTPGHSPGSLSYVFHDQEVVFAGDALFKGSIGRTDLPNGDLETLLSSITDKLLNLNSHFTVYPGHGMKTTIKNEIDTNPFLI